MAISLFIFIIFFAYLAWQRPVWAIAFLVAFLPGYLLRFKVGFLPMTLLELMLLILFLVWLARCLLVWPLQDFTELKKIGPWRWPIILFLLAATIAVVTSPNIRSALGIWKAYFIEPVLFFLVFITTIKERKDLKLIFLALGFSALYISVIAIYQKFTGFAIPNLFWQAEATRRVTSIFGYPNAVGLYLAPLIVLFFSFLASEKWRQNFKIYFFIFCAAIFSFLAIIWSKTEGAWLAVGLGIFFFCLFRKHLRIVAVAALVLFFIAMLISPAMLNYFQQKALLQDYSGKIRLSMWQETWEMLQDRPLFGSGLAGYQQIIAPYHKLKGIEIYLYPHNIILNFWSETGILGLLAFLWLLAIFFYYGWRRRKQTIAKGLMAAMMAILAHGLVDAPYFKNDLSVLFWLMIGWLHLESKKL